MGSRDSSADNSISLYDGKTGKRLQTHSKLPFVLRMVWSPDGGILAAAGTDGVVRLFDRDLKLIHDLRGHLGGGLLFCAMDWSIDGKTLITIDVLTVRKWEAASGKLLGAMPRPVHYQGENIDATWMGAWQFSPDGRHLTAPSGGLRIYNVETGELEGAMLPLLDGCCAFVSPDGHYQTTPQGEQQLVYVVQKPDGQELLSPQEFAAKYGWKNDPSKVKLPE